MYSRSEIVGNAIMNGEKLKLIFSCISKIKVYSSAQLMSRVLTKSLNLIGC